MHSTTSHLALFLVEASVVGLLYVTLFRARAKLGLAPLFIAIGAFQYLQVVLGLSLYVEFAPGWSISPGSACFFTASLFAILLVYIREDADQTRALLYGLVAANVSLTLASSLAALHFKLPGIANPLGVPPELFASDVRIMFAGTASLTLDFFVLVWAYETGARLFRNRVFPSVLASLGATIVIDSLTFCVLAFWGRPAFFELLRSNLVGKLLFGVLFAGLFSIYLQIFGKSSRERLLEGSQAIDIFRHLSYRQRYELAKKRSERDSLTGISNRSFFDKAIELQLRKAERDGTNLALWLVDLDHFKSVNDEFGHQAGDAVLKEFAKRLSAQLRSSDVVSRYGGEEFAVLSPGQSPAVTKRVAERVLTELASRPIETARARARSVTATIGIALFPDDGSTVEQLIEAADRRLYEGKRAGRFRVIGPQSSDEDQP